MAARKRSQKQTSSKLLLSHMSKWSSLYPLPRYEEKVDELLKKITNVRILNKTLAELVENCDHAGQRTHK